MTRIMRVLSFTLIFSLPGYAQAQTATYHLHKEASTTSGLYQLKTAGPDGGSTSINSTSLNGQPVGEYLIKAFDTQAGVPNASGLIPAGSTVTFTLWMDKSNNNGTIYPRAKLNLNSAAGASLCMATGPTALTTSTTKYTLACTTGTAVTMATTDRFYLWTGINMTAGVGSNNTTARIRIEGTLNGNYDSQIVVPLPVVVPTISALLPTLGPVGTSVTISGSNFGATQGTSTITFNGTGATPSSWSNTAIVAPVPMGATTGLVVVTVGGNASNGVSFTVNHPITYVYDELGRLAGAVDPAGETAIYAYDAVGNVLSISRQSSATVSIIEFIPNSGPVGAIVTIYGTGFSTTASQNTVAFNGVAATVTSSNSTQIVASVPFGATTGSISVTTPSGSATSGTSFLVTASTGAPTITEFTPTNGTLGTAVTITGTNFDTTPNSNKVAFNTTYSIVSSVTATTITTSVPSNATSGRISVATPYGNAMSTEDFIVPPAPYVPADVQVIDRMAIGGTKTVTITTPNRIALILFDGSAGQRISLRMSSVTIPASYVTLYNPNGTTLATTTGGVGTSGAFIDTQTLLATGTYTILVDPSSNYTGSMMLTLYEVPADVTGTIVPGGAAVPVAITTPGQNARLTFTGAAGQRISFNMSGITIAVSDAYIYNPDGSTLTSKSVGIPPSSSFIDTQTLPATGTYTILVDPSSSYTGNMTLTLYEVLADVTGTIVPGGAAVPVAITTPGQNASLTFSGTVGQRVSLNITNIVTIPISTIYIYNPDGTTLVSKSVNTPPSSAFIDAQTLPVTGTYTIFVNPYGSYTGSMTLTLYQVPADVTGTITIGGSTVQVTITVPGQNGSLTFNGTSGQQVTVRVTNNTMSTVTVKLLKPDGTTLTSKTSSSSNFNLTTQTLPTTGTYTITIDPSEANTGSMKVSVTSP